MLIEKARFRHSMLTLLSISMKWTDFMLLAMICPQTKPIINTDVSPLLNAWSTAYLA